jgi:hypothetical protein
MILLLLSIRPTSRAPGHAIPHPMMDTFVIPFLTYGVSTIVCSMRLGALAAGN